jgi:transcriptional regulator with XRE-family HTH domain
MGLLAGASIRALRERLGVSQDQLSEVLGCGKKSLSRWENGREYPSQLVNTLLRLLETNKVTPEDIRAARQPRLTPCEKIVHFPPVEASALRPSGRNSGRWHPSRRSDYL